MKTGCYALCANASLGRPGAARRSESFDNVLTAPVTVNALLGSKVVRHCLVGFYAI